MAHATQKKAAKDYPDQGIKKGDMYWFAEVKTGPRSSRTIRSLKPIPRSQLTSSEFLSAAYGFDEELQECNDLDDLRSIAERIGELGEETQEKLDNMPEGLQQGDTGQMLEERVSQCEDWKQSIEDACDEAESNIQAAEQDLEEGEVLSDEKKNEIIGDAKQGIDCPF